MDDRIDRYENRSEKLLFICHAERNALDNSVLGVEGGILYSSKFPCNECVKSIIQRGISKVVTFPFDPSKKDGEYKLGHSMIMLNEAGIQLCQYDFDVFNTWRMR